jgi:polar amino acid transport system substrate-binding protein
MAITIVIAIVTFVAGLGLGYFIFNPPPAKAVLVVGTNVPFPPFESYNDTSGKYEGFDIDIAQLIANALGEQMQVRNFQDFGVLLTTVGRGGVDMAVSAITMSGPIGASRNDTMSFSNPYYNANQAVIVLSSSSFTCPNNVCTPTQVGNQTIGVQSATTSEGWVDTYITPFDPNNATDIHRYASVSTEIDALRTGVYNLMIIDAGPAASIVASSAGAFKLAGTIITNELYGFAVAHRDPKGLLPTINSVIAQIKSDGTYDQLITKWFGA